MNDNLDSTLPVSPNSTDMVTWGSQSLTLDFGAIFKEGCRLARSMCSSRDHTAQRTRLTIPDQTIATNVPLRECRSTPRTLRTASSPSVSPGSVYLWRCGSKQVTFDRRHDLDLQTIWTHPCLVRTLESSLARRTSARTVHIHMEGPDS
jgi:hypothetical protein